MGRVNTMVAARVRRHTRVRKNLAGTTERPRLAVFRSSQHIYAQLIDDTAGRTLVSASTVDNELREKLKDTPKAIAARQVGKLVAERAKAQGISEVVFDRGGFRYHGRVKEVADGAREEGLKF